MDDPELDTLLAKVAAMPRRRPPIERIGLTRFELRRRLGGGGFGDVYEARDREHGTMVALKALRSAHPEWVYRFKREFRVVGDLAHPNLARLYELFCEHDQWYLTMELVDGLPFDDHLDRAPDQLRACFAQLALGVTALHRASCLHRDLKPSNALVERTGRVVLLDFGLALETRGPLHTKVAGTPAFMAPELATSGPTTATDWYAFGVILSGILKKGRGPFDGDLDALAQRLLSPRPEDRPGADEILGVLGAAVPARAVLRHDEAARFVGRADELAQLDDALASCAGGRAAVAIVHGPPGMGMTALVERFTDARRADVTVYEGRCHESESVPYKGIDGAIDALGVELAARDAAEVDALLPPGAGALAQMFPVLKRIEGFARAQRREPRTRPPVESRRAAVDALRVLLERLGNERPRALFVDDLQWASDDTVQLALELLAEPAPPILLIVAHRSDAVGRSAPLDQFLAGVRELSTLAHHDVAVGPLDPAGVAELLAGRATPTLDDAMRETGGHPYLLARLLGDEADLEVQLGALEPEARAVLDVVSIAGAPLRPRAVFDAADIPWDPAVLDRLRRQKLIHRLAASADAEIEAYHERVRELARGAMADDAQRRVHGRIAHALERGGPVAPERLAHHHRLAGDPARALDWTRRAARAASDALAFARAAELCLQAVALAADDRQRLVVLEELADAQVQCGRPGDAAATCTAAMELARRIGDPAAEDRMRARAGEHFLIAGHLDRGLGLIQAALEAVDVGMPADPAVAVAQWFNHGGALAVRGLAFQPRAAADVPPTLLRKVDLQLAMARALSLTDLRAPLLATRGLLDALEAGEPARVQLALSLYVFATCARAPDHPLVVEAEQAAIALAEELDDPRARGWAELARGMRASQAERYGDGLAAMREAERWFLACGDAYAREVSIARATTAIICGNGVNLPYARRVHARTLIDARDRGDLFARTWMQMTNAWLELAWGRPTAARRDLQLAREIWPHVPESLFDALAVLNAIAIAVYEDPAHSWPVIDELGQRFRRRFTFLLPYPRGFYCRVAGAGAIATFHAGRADEAETRRRMAQVIDDSAELVYARAGHGALRAQVALLDGDRPRALALFEESARHWDAVHQRVQAHAARLRIAQLRGDADAEAAAASELRSQGVADPDRYATLFVGPPPLTPRG